MGGTAAYQATTPQLGGPGMLNGRMVTAPVVRLTLKNWVLGRTIGLHSASGALRALCAPNTKQRRPTLYVTGYRLL